MFLKIKQCLEQNIREQIECKRPASIKQMNRVQNTHSAKRWMYQPSLSFFISLLDIPPFFRNMYPSLFFRNMNPSHFFSPSLENTKFYDDTPESGRLKKFNKKPWKPTTYRNFESSVLNVS